MKRLTGAAIIVVIGLILMAMTAGINDAGQRTVIQTPSGNLSVKFTPGFYLTYFGTTTKYSDVITFDYDKTPAREGEDSVLDQLGISVRYQDGGMGTVFGKSRYALPDDEATMLELHKDFRSNIGVANKLLRPVTEEAMNLTAGLMRSEEAYATKRAIFTQMAKSQIASGKFITEIKTIVVLNTATGKSVETEVPIIVTKGGVRQHQASDLAKYGVRLASIQLNDPGFELKTMQQISDKRDATMAIITAKANAEKAKQETITAEEEGRANVMRAKYAKEVLKEEFVVDAQRKKEVAEINANQKVEVAKLSLLEAKQNRLRAIEVKQTNILLGEGEAKRKELVMKADGALQQKLDAYVKVNQAYATEFGKQKWVPEIQMGVIKGGNSNNATALIEMLTASTAKSLALDLRPKK